MKKFFALLALVLGVVSCQTEGFDVNVGGEQDVNITVSLPEGTRANSALGAFGDNVNFDEYDVRFKCEVHYGTEKKVLPVQISDNGKSATFPVRLIANRDYKFVVWADLVLEDSTADHHYNTAGGLENITLNDTWVAMDETRDAFTCSETRRFERGEPINLTLTRPFAKLRVITTDILDLMGIEPTTATVAYTTPHYEGFNALEQKPVEKQKNQDHNNFEIASYGESGANKTLFTDYFFAQEGDIVNFYMKVYDQNDDLIDEQKNFNTPIPVNRNYVTTIKGNILTYADDFTVTINDAFDNAGNLEDIPYYYAAVTNGVDLIKALMAGNEVIALNDITVTYADLVAATRATTPVYPVINLNGFTITIENNNSDALVNLNGGALKVEGEGTIESTSGALVETIYNAGEATIAEAAATNVVDYMADIKKAFTDGDEYTLLFDFAISEGLTLANGKNLVLDLNGKTITGTDNATGSFGLITNKGNLTVKNGTITLEAKNNRNWNAYSSVISNTVGGNLVVENVTLEHLGGTDMAYGIDNLTNGKGTYAETTINDKAVVKSTYRAVRQFLNGIEAQNILTVNAGAVIEGANKSIWMQDPSAKANTGKLVVNEGATLNGDVYLFVTAGSTMWPVEVSIAASAVKGEVLTGNVPAGYAVVKENGVWTVVADTVVTTAEELVAAMKAAKSGETIVCATDIVVEGTTSLNINGATVVGATFKNESGTAVKDTINGKFVDCTFEGSNALRWCYSGATCEFENCVFSGKTYGVHFDGNANPVTFRNCTISGFNAFAGSIEMVTFEGCTFVGNGKSGYNGANLWGSATLKNCEFTFDGTTANEWIDCIGADKTYTFENCTVNGVAYTAENYTEFEQIFSRNVFNVKINNVSVVSSQEALVTALKAGGDVTVAAGEYTFPASSVQAGQTIVCQEGVVFTGTSGLNIKGATVIGATFKNEGGQAVSGTIYGTFKGCTFIGQETLRWCYTTAGQTSVFEDCVIKTTLRGFHFDAMDGDVTFRNCEINGFNAYSGKGTMTLEGCTFGHDASKYNGLNIYSNTNVINCTFNYVSGNTNFIDMEGTGKTLKITNCAATLDGVDTNIGDFVGGSKLADNTVIIK